MKFDEFAKRLIDCPEVLAGLLHAACPSLPESLDLERAVQVKELPTTRLRTLVPDALFEVPVQDPEAWPVLDPQDGLAAVLVEATTKPGPHILPQVADYLAQYQLSLDAQKVAWRPVFCVVFSMGPDRSRALEQLASAEGPDLAVWPCVSRPTLLLVASCRQEDCEAAWERSPLLGFGMELTVAVKRGRRSVLSLMEARGDEVMAARVRYEAEGQRRCLSAVESMLEFIEDMPSDSPEEARAWLWEVEEWWGELGERHGLGRERAMAEAKTVYDYLREEAWRGGLEKGLQQGLQQGLEEGTVRTLRRAIYDVLEERFGEVPEAVRRGLEAEADPDRLEGLVRRALRVSRPEDLLEELE